MRACSLTGWMQRWLRLMLSIWFVVIGGCDQVVDEDDNIDSGVTTSLHGQVNLIMEISGADAVRMMDDRAQLEAQLGVDYQFIATMLWINDTTIEVRAHIPSLVVRINGQEATTKNDGTFDITNVILNDGDVITVGDVDGFVFFSQSLTKADLASQTVLVNNAMDYDLMIVKEDAYMSMEKSTPNSYPCLDNNGTGSGGFYYSDCYMSLFYGPANYSWMCWYEAMNVYHDHSGNIWCDGTHNCSLFVHNWIWGCQSWHKHSGYWKVGSGC